MMDGVDVWAISSVLQAVSDRLLWGDPVTGGLELSQQLEKPIHSWNYDSRETSCSIGIADWNRAGVRLHSEGPEQISLALDAA